MHKQPWQIRVALLATLLLWFALAKSGHWGHLSFEHPFTPPAVAHDPHQHHSHPEASQSHSDQHPNPAPNTHLQGCWLCSIALLVETHNPLPTPMPWAIRERWRAPSSPLVSNYAQYNQLSRAPPNPKVPPV